jgi:hypothetical protein
MKKLGSFAVLILVLALTAELSPYLISPIIAGKSFSKANLLSQLDSYTDTLTFNEVLKAEAGKTTHDLHPYIGYVMADCCNSNKYGLHGPDPLSPDFEDHYKVAIVGGSVAAGLYGHAHETLERLISEAGIAGDKTVTSFCLAVQGNKQPQQIMGLSWMLSMGADFDLVINLDGFNEIVLPMADNRPAKIHSTYPRNWQMYARKSVNMDQLLATGNKVSISKKLSELNSSTAASTWRHSRIGLMFWNAKRIKLENELSIAEQQLQDALTIESERQISGPIQPEMEEEAYRRNAAEYWSNCSQILNGLCEGNDISYFHFLQPNQYVEDTKKFTSEEMQNAYEEEVFAYKTAVVKGYPMLGAKGDLLIAKGVHYYDLTQIYANVSETIYADKCCHVNTRGSEIMAAEIVDRIAYDLKNQP